MPIKKYNQEHIEWLKKNVPGKFLDDSLKNFNETFNLNLSYSTYKALVYRFNLQTGMQCKIKPETRISRMLLTPDELKIFKENNSYKTAEEMVIFCKEKFNKNLTTNQIREIRQRNHFISGLTGQFEKGNIPANKGKKGIHVPGTDKTWFKKGHKPHNTLPVNSEVLTTDGYLKIKIAEPNVWEYKHILIWKKHNGKIPKNKCCIFLDKNPLNCVIENLTLIDRNELAQLNKNKLITNSRELTSASIQLIRLRQKIKGKENEL